MKQEQAYQLANYFSAAVIKPLTLVGVMALGLTTPAVAGELQGCYVPKNGFAESLSSSPTEQLGLYKIVLKREGWNQLSSHEQDQTQRRLVLSGPFRGLIPDPVSDPLTLQHILSSRDREGLLYTAGDSFAVQGVECEGGILQGVETLNPVAGTGAYQGLQPGGWVQVQGSVNACPGDPEFGRNDFVVVPGQGALCFE